MVKVQDYIKSALLVGLLASCSGQKFSSISSDDKNKLSQKPRAACEFSEIDYQLDAQVLSFEVNRNVDIGFGFNLLDSWFKLFDMNFKLKKTELTVKTDVREFLKPADPFAIAVGKGTLTRNEIGFKVGLQQVGGSINWMKETPIYEVMKRALIESITKTAENLKNEDPLWSTVIVQQVSENEWMIPAGRGAGLRAGDEFYVYNVEHIWNGDPCTSPYRGMHVTTAEPLAILEIAKPSGDQPQVNIDRNYAVLKMKQSFQTDEVINLGAYVYLVPKGETRVLKKSVYLRKILPFIFAYKNSSQQEIQQDMSPLLKGALQPILADYGFYLKDLTD